MYAYVCTCPRAGSSLDQVQHTPGYVRVSRAGVGTKKAPRSARITGPGASFTRLHPYEVTHGFHLPSRLGVWLPVRVDGGQPQR